MDSRSRLRSTRDVNRPPSRPDPVGSAPRLRSQARDGARSTPPSWRKTGANLPRKLRDQGRPSRRRSWRSRNPSTFWTWASVRLPCRHGLLISHKAKPRIGEAHRTARSDGPRHPARMNTCWQVNPGIVHRLVERRAMYWRWWGDGIIGTLLSIERRRPNVSQEAVKPFIYGAAIEDKRYAPASIKVDSPVTKGGTWEILAAKEPLESIWVPSASTSLAARSIRFQLN